MFINFLAIMVSTGFVTLDPEQFVSKELNDYSVKGAEIAFFASLQINKPKFGLWGSTWLGPQVVSAWHQWTLQEDHKGFNFGVLWRVKPEARIFEIKTTEDWQYLYDKYGEGLDFCGSWMGGINWVKAQKDIDVVHLADMNISSVGPKKDVSIGFWNAESAVVLNKDAVDWDWHTPVSWG